MRAVVQGLRLGPHLALWRHMEASSQALPRRTLANCAHPLSAPPASCFSPVTQARPRVRPGRGAEWSPGPQPGCRSRSTHSSQRLPLRPASLWLRLPNAWATQPVLATHLSLHLCSWIPHLCLIPPVSPGAPPAHVLQCPGSKPWHGVCLSPLQTPGRARHSHYHRSPTPVPAQPLRAPRSTMEPRGTSDPAGHAHSILPTLLPASRPGWVVLTHGLRITAWLKWGAPSIPPHIGEPQVLS